MSEERTLALLHLAKMRADGQLDDEQFAAAREGLPPLEASDEDALNDEDLADEAASGEQTMDDFQNYDYEAELPGNKGMRAVHKAMASVRKACRKALETIEEPDVRAHLGEHENGIGKALKAMMGLHAKKYKGTPPLPEEYEDEDEIMETKMVDMVEDEDMDGKGVDGGMSYEDAEAGGSVLGIRPEDEDEADEMSDEEAMQLSKSLPALERRLGIR